MYKMMKILIFMLVIDYSLCNPIDFFSHFKNEIGDRVQEKQFPESSDKVIPGPIEASSTSDLPRADYPFNNQNSNPEFQIAKDKSSSFPSTPNQEKMRPGRPQLEKSFNPMLDNFFLKPFMAINKRQSSPGVNLQSANQKIKPQGNHLPTSIPEVMEILSSFGRRTMPDLKFSPSSKKDGPRVENLGLRNISNVGEKATRPMTLSSLFSQLKNSFRDLSRSSQRPEKGFLNLPKFFGKVDREDTERPSSFGKKELPVQQGPTAKRKSFLFNLPDLISGFSFKSGSPTGFLKKTDRNGVPIQELPATVYKKSKAEFRGSSPDPLSPTSLSSYQTSRQQNVKPNPYPVEKNPPQSTENQKVVKKSGQVKTEDSRRHDKPPIIIYQGKAPPVHVFEKYN